MDLGGDQVESNGVESLAGEWIAIIGGIDTIDT